MIPSTALPDLDCFRAEDYHQIREMDDISAYSPNDSPNILINDEDLAKIKREINPLPASENKILPRPPVSAIRYEDGVFVRFTKPLSLASLSHANIYIKELNLYFPSTELKNIHKQLWRHFSRYFGKAKNNALTSEEKRTWIKIVDTIDYPAFRNEYAPPLCEKGIIKDKRRGVVTVKWRNGKTEKFALNLSSAFSNLEVNDYFSAMIRRGTGNLLISIERIQLLDVSELHSDFDYDTLKTF